LIIILYLTKYSYIFYVLLQLVHECVTRTFPMMIIIKLNTLDDEACKVNNKYAILEGRWNYFDHASNLDVSSTPVKSAAFAGNPRLKEKKKKIKKFVDENRN